MIEYIEISGFSCRHQLSAFSREKENMLFLPGNLQEIESMHFFVNRFSEEFNFSIVELPGYGSAQPLDPKFNISFVAECAANYAIEVFNGEPFHLVACSYSSAVGLELAKLQPGYLLTMSLLGAMPSIPDSDRRTFISLMNSALHDRKKFAIDFIEFLANRGAGIPRLETFIRAAKIKAIKNSEDDAWRFINNTVRILSYFPSDIDNIFVPTMCATGEFDTYVTPERCKSLASMLGNAEYFDIPGCDHLFHLEDPSACLSLIQGFIGTLHRNSSLYNESRTEQLTA